MSFSVPPWVRVLVAGFIIVGLPSLAYYFFSTINKQRKETQKEKGEKEKAEKRLKEQLIKEKVSKGIQNIERADLVPTWFNNDNCATIVNEKKPFLLFFWKPSTYNLWIATYEPAFGKTEEKINYFEILKGITPIEGKRQEVIEHFKKALSSDHPAAEIYNSCYINKLPPLVQDYKNIAKRKVNLLPQANPDDYLHPYDIVKVNRKGGTYQHVAIYLGNKKVAHIPNTKNPVRVDNWEDFLKGEGKIEIHRPFIPFKKPELIKKHIDIAVKAGYGAGKYHLLKENCEHFATMCVYGLGFCRQKNFDTINEITNGSEYLLQSIKESNEFFEKLSKNQVQYETWEEISPK